MDVLELERAPLRQESRAKRMKAATQAAHERIDRQIMAADPFASRENFGRFVRLQYRIHHAVDPLFRSPALAALLPDLAGRRRLDLVEQDAADLGVSLPELPAASDAPADVASALGWLYVVEGSNLGAAFLLKAAAKLNLNEDFGARHLAGHPAGRGLHWRTFTAALDAVPLSEADEARAVAGAEAAFAMVADRIAVEFA
ncbi:biliverdin-producing heme oxygenase [Azorhizobium caulinodans]|uniref:Heme oxygenase n=1 Tax=Azorhizobium caulinodans (strain ATCC 43989 / DSM 5975 / JCM 20966 / LMG 6465 / NBRC 14845 / NCIMB 13405 / ORS 571) TaxID=438753 RepID=A8I6T0_AZOC5|nr:biliverdin-producing heme oxygenase [Azorhizobium caulinodans]BAF88038.1 heme oxygenase [Azorhizobium caulinodans ORS 571]